MAMARYPASLCLRQDLRFDVCYRTEGFLRADHELHQPVAMTICNVSRTGFMAAGDIGLARGERILVRLPHAGHIDAFAMWTEPERAGFQFEKPLNPQLFIAILTAFGYRPLPLQPARIRQTPGRSPRHGQPPPSR